MYKNSMFIYTPSIPFKYAPTLTWCKVAQWTRGKDKSLNLYFLLWLIPHVKSFHPTFLHLYRITKIDNHHCNMTFSTRQQHKKITELLDSYDLFSSFYVTDLLIYDQHLLESRRKKFIKLSMKFIPLEENQ